MEPEALNALAQALATLGGWAAAWGMLAFMFYKIFMVQKEQIDKLFDTLQDVVQYVCSTHTKCPYADDLPNPDDTG